MVAGLLWMHGVHLGSRIHGVKVYNEKGLYEDEVWVKFNDHCLTAAGGSWLNPPNPENSSLLSVDELLRAMVRYEARDIWGVKDGRLCLLMDLYEPAVRDLNPHLVVVHRNPLSVARSLARWWVRSVDFGAYLAGVYLSRLCEWLGRHRDWPVLHLAYEDVLADPVGEAQRLGAFAGVAMDEERALDFVDPELRHF